MKRATRRTPGCSIRPTGPEDALDGVVRSYVDHYRLGARQEMEFYARLPLADAIKHAALCRRPDGKRYRHQCRIPAASLVVAHRRLRDSTVSSCRSFEELHAFVEETTRDIHMIGALTVYDVAHRIGSHLGLAPTKVYLHSGTSVGARHLGFRRRKTIAVRELPPAFSQLSAAEIEDCLCIYKDDLARIAKL